MSKLLIHPTMHIDFGVASVDRLNPNLTINSITETPVFRYKGGDADGTNWDHWGYGEILPLQAGTAPSYNQGSPLLGSNDDSVKFNDGGYYQASGSALADIATEDFVIEALIKTDWTQSGRNIADKRTTIGYLFGRNSATEQVRIKIQDSGGSTQVFSGNLSSGGWSLVQLFADRSGSAQFYVNGEASGSAGSITAISGSLSNSDNLTLGANAGGGNNLDSTVAYLALWKRASWLDTHLQATVAKERFAMLTGVYPTFAAGTSVPNTMTRSSAGYLDKIESGNRKLYYVGENWPRTCYRQDSNNEDVKGYLSEGQTTNLQVRSQEFDSAAWTDVRCSVSSNTSESPDGSTTADTLVEDNTASNSHYIYDAVSLTNGTNYTYSVFCKPSNRDWLRLYVITASLRPECYFDVSNGTVGTANNCVGRISGPYYDGFYRCEISWTANSTQSVNALVAIASGDGGSSFDGLNQNSLIAWGAQFEEGDYASSYIPTVAASVTRNADSLQYKGDDGNLGGVGSEQQGAVECTVLTTDHTPSGTLTPLVISDGGDGNDRMQLQAIATNGNGKMVLRSTGEANGDVALTSKLTDGIAQRMLVSWQEKLAYIKLLAQDNVVVSGGAPPDDLDLIEIGHYIGNVNHWNGLVADIKFFNRFKHS